MVVFKQFGFPRPPLEALLLLQWALPKRKQMNSSEHHYPANIKSPTDILMMLFQTPSFTSVVNLSPRQQHPSLWVALPVQASTRENTMPGFQRCSHTAVFGQTFKESTHICFLPLKDWEDSTACLQHLLLNVIVWLAPPLFLTSSSTDRNPKQTLACSK